MMNIGEYMLVRQEKMCCSLPRVDDSLDGLKSRTRHIRCRYKLRCRPSRSVSKNDSYVGLRTAPMLGRQVPQCPRVIPVSFYSGRTFM